jgi:hypothetical protein
MAHQPYRLLTQSTNFQPQRCNFGPQLFDHIGAGHFRRFSFGIAADIMKLIQIAV